MPLIDGWENFYVIVGSSAAALTGLMFVVITLTAEMRTGQEDGGSAMDGVFIHNGDGGPGGHCVDGCVQDLGQCSGRRGSLGV